MESKGITNNNGGAILKKQNGIAYSSALKFNSYHLIQLGTNDRDIKLYNK